MVPPQASAVPATKKRGKLPLIIICVVCIAAGGAVPMVVNVDALMGKKKDESKAKPKSDHKTATVPFGDVVVNLAEDRMNRYLRMKIALKVDEEDEANAVLLVTKHKAALKSKLIGYLASKTLKDVSGSVGVNKLQREILEKFEEILYPEGENHLREILFEEYVVQ